MRRSTPWLALAGAGALGTGALLVRRRRGSRDLTGQVALVTGASRGLGLLICQELAARGCRLVICARRPDELAAARAQLAATGADVLAVPTDLTDRRQVDQLVATATQSFGRLDLVVNNAGIIQVGPVAQQSADEFTRAVDVMLLAPVYLTLAALPHLETAPAGRVINVTSLGARLPVPHLLPYVAAKSGLLGFSESLAAELARRGITVTTVMPGLMRTGSHLRAEFTGQATREFSWFAALASAPLLSMSASRAARRIVAAAVAGRTTIILTPVAKIATRFAGLAPATTTRLSGLGGRLLPAPADESTPGQIGEQVAAASPSRARSLLTTLGRRAAKRFQPAAEPPP